MKRVFYNDNGNIIIDFKAIEEMARLLGLPYSDVVFVRSQGEGRGKIKGEW